jgi:uncharacterized protein
MSGGDWKDLYQAACDGDLALVQYHIAQGVNPNYLHPEVMCSPLVASLIHGHVEVARYLLDHGADPDLLSDYDGLTPLQAARRYGHVEFARLLEQRGARAVPATSSESVWRRFLPF